MSQGSDHSEESSGAPAGPARAAGFDHVPVMRDQVIESFGAVPPGIVVDATLGGAGHAEALLRSRDDLGLVGIDRDEQAIDAATSRLAPFGDRVAVVHGRAGDLDAVLDQLDIDLVSGVFLDLGVSSPQLDIGERGFSYRADGPLDMRMDTSADLRAHDVVNGYDAERLEGLIRELGDERFARRVASAIVAARPIADTRTLAEVVVSAIPAATRRTGGHPAKRTFQAIRMAVNGELEELASALDSGIDRLRVGGRFAVLSYHSGEDRLVKDRFVTAEDGGCVCPPRLPCTCGAQRVGRRVRRGGTVPDEAEIDVNPRARSARLRVLERIEPEPVR